MAVFDASDIVEVAIRIEENGANFYRYAAQIAGKEELKSLYSHLTAEEVKHQQIFTKIRASMDPLIPPEGYEGEYATYLQSYVDHHLVFKTKAFKDALAKIADEVSALDFAIRRELDSIFYYREIVELLPAGGREEIERIIAEEKRHFIKLSEVRDSQSR
jgi:rubrerythrin